MPNSTTPAKTTGSTTTRTTKTPTDRKSKAEDKPGYRFTIDGTTYTLPPIGNEAERLPAGLTMDVVENPDDEQAQARVAFALLRLLAPPAALAALRGLSTGELMKVVGEWMSQGESAGSSEQ